MAASWRCRGNKSKIYRTDSLLNPYDRDAMPGSILKIEDDNFDAPKRASTSASFTVWRFRRSVMRCFCVKKWHSSPTAERVNNKEKTDGRSTALAIC